MSRPTNPSWRGPAALGVVGTTAVILPAFLTGALAVQVRADLGIDEAAIGLAIGAFFLGSTIGSSPLGRLAERLGPGPALRLGLATTALANLAVAGLVGDGPTLAGILVIAGLANALGQPAINLLVVRAVASERLGLVMALKQSGMPAASLLGGLAVPALALTVGWRAGFLVGAALAVAAIALLRRIERAGVVPVVARGRVTGAPTTVDRSTDRRPNDRPASGQPAPGRPDQPRSVLLLMAVVGVLGGGAANIVVGYLVSGAVEAGIEPGPAGLILTVGSALGIASRLAHGWLADKGRIRALPRVMLLLTLGAGGALLLAIDQPTAYVVASPIVFAAGWAWPGLFNLVVVETNRSAPAAATGLTQTGVYLGSILGPIVAGALISWSGYRAAWLLTAVALALAAVATTVVRTALARVERPPVPG